jgi:hypothetical protein
MGLRTREIPLSSILGNNRFSKALQVKSINLVDCPEELLREGYRSQSIILDPNEELDDNDVTLIQGENDGGWFDSDVI